MKEQISTEVAKEVAKSIGPVAKTVAENATAAANTASSATEGLSGELLKRADKVAEWASNGIGHAVDAAGKVADVAYVQAVDIATQYIHFGMAINTLLILISLIAIGISIWTFTRVFKVKHPDAQGGLACLSLIAFGIGAVIFGTNIRDTLLVYFAPKIWIMKELAELAKASGAMN